MVEKEVKECMKYIIYRVQAREWERNYSKSDKGKKRRKKYNRKYEQKQTTMKRRKEWRQSDKGKEWFKEYAKKNAKKNIKKIHIREMYRGIKERCKTNGGSIGKTKYHIEGFGWVHPPIHGGDTWCWDGVTREN